jgi:FkbM family methyltransferase
MKSSDLLVKRIGRIGQRVSRIGSMLRMDYSMAERMSLVSASRSSGHEVDLLEFHVSHVNSFAFQYALREIFIKGDYRFNSEKDCPVILDCGANIGLATLFFKHLYPKARITCFEADPATASILQRNVEQNHLQEVSVHNLMLANVEEERLFYVSADGAGSLDMSAIADRLPNRREIRVRAGKLSHYIDGTVDRLNAHFRHYLDCQSTCIAKAAMLQKGYSSLLFGASLNFMKSG